METDAQPAADPPKDRKTYNGIEHFPNMQMGLAHYRTLDPGERGCTSHVVTRAREKRSGRPAMLREQHEEHQRSHHTFRRKGWCGKGRWLQAKARLGAEATLARLGPRTAMSGCGIDPKSEKFYALTPYNSMGGNPVSMVDPDGDIAVLAAIGIGAAIGAIGGGITTKSWDGVWKGALVGAIGGAIPQIGFVSSLGHIGSGAISGAITGGLNAGLNETNVLKGVVVGAAIGAAVGYVQDGLQHAKEAKAARRELIASGYDPDGAVGMTNNDLENFVQAHSELNTMYNEAGLPELNAGTPPSGYELMSDGLFRSPKNNLVAGVTRDLNGISIHIAPDRFTKAIKLYTTVGHELNHAVDFYSGAFASWSAMGGRGFARNISEFKAHSWSLGVGRQISFETTRHQAMLDYYLSQMSINDWGNFLKLYGF